MMKCVFICWRLGSAFRPQNYFSYFDLVAVAGSAVRKRRARFATEDDLSAGPRSKLAMAADEVGVQMSFDDVFDFQTVGLRFGDVLIDVALRIDDHGFAFGTDQVGGMSKTPEIKLFEVHP